MDLSNLDKRFKKMTNDFPQARKNLIENGGEKLYRKVLNNIDFNVDEHSGKLKKGVTKKIGSGGGYVAIRPNSTIAPHTPLVENGHKLVRGDKVVGWVSGKHMYRNALNELADELEQDAEKMINEMVGDIFD